MFLLIDNYDSFTYNLVQAFQTLGKDPVVLKNDDPAILELAKSPDLEMVCISPGPGRPENSGLCPQFLDELDPQTPVLGICLGHQLLGLHAGADIEIAPVIMHGKQAQISHDGKGMFAGMPAPMLVGRYHSLVVGENEKTRGKFAVTARGTNGEVMALQYMDRPWVGAQFHPESVLTESGLEFLGNFPDAIKPKKYSIPQMLEHLANKKDMNPDMAAQGFAALMDGQMSPVQAGAFLMGLRIKGENADELAEAMSAALARAVPVPTTAEKRLDIVGTGGDGKHSFNCSTASALLLAGMGYKVIKHGNRAVSSTCGAADALEGLGIQLENDPVAINQMLEKRNFAFLFAPFFHPCFKNIAPVRKELGIRTLFNILGPMINPARPTHLLMGVAMPELVDLVAKTLVSSSLQRAAICCGAGGYDELTPLGPNRLALLHNGVISELVLDPARYGIPPCRADELACHSKDEAIAVLSEILAGSGPKAMQDMVILNAGAAIFLMEEGISMDDAIAKAMRALHSGIAMKAVNNA